MNEAIKKKKSTKKYSETIAWVCIWIPCTALPLAVLQLAKPLVLVAFLVVLEMHIKPVYASRAADYISSIVCASDKTHKVAYEYEANSIPPFTWIWEKIVWSWAFCHQCSCLKNVNRHSVYHLEYVTCQVEITLLLCVTLERNTVNFNLAILRTHCVCSFG